MGRPKTKRTENLANIRKFIEPVQLMRFTALRDFVALLNEPDIPESVQIDDRFFAQLLWLAFHEYRVPQKIVNEKLRLSDGTLGRWMQAENLPLAGLRPHVVATISEILSDFVTRSIQLKTANDNAGKPTVLWGVWKAA